MDGLTLHQLRCFDAVVAEGSFQAAAARLGRTHPTIFTAVKNLEGQIGLQALRADAVVNRQAKIMQLAGAPFCVHGPGQELSRPFPMYRG